MLASVAGIGDAGDWTAAAEVCCVKSQARGWRDGSDRRRCTGGACGGGSGGGTNLQSTLWCDWGVDWRGIRESTTTLRTSLGGTKLGGGCDYRVWTWLRILNVGAFLCRAAIADCAQVGFEDVWTLVESQLLRAGAFAGDRDMSAVHVHLSVSYTILP